MGFLSISLFLLLHLLTSHLLLLQIFHPYGVRNGREFLLLQIFHPYGVRNTIAFLRLRFLFYRYLFNTSPLPLSLKERGDYGKNSLATNISPLWGCFLYLCSYFFSYKYFTPTGLGTQLLFYVYVFCFTDTYLTPHPRPSP